MSSRLRDIVNKLIRNKIHTGSVIWAAMAGIGSAATFTNPIGNGADPWVIRWQGAYYLCSSNGGCNVSKSEKLQDVCTAPKVRVWTPPADSAYSSGVWAPELHYLQGKWYIYVAADNGDNYTHHMYVLEGTTQNPQDPFVLKAKISDATDRWAIDGTVLTTDDDKLYFIWSGWEGSENVCQNLYIAPMSDPWTISGERVLISSPEYAWEKKGGTPLINEGPEVLKHDGSLFIIYSASGSWTDDYCLGQLRFKGGDILSKDSWGKDSLPVFAKTDTVFGPGHCSFVKSPDSTEDWIVYHAAKFRGAGWNRNVRIQKFDWKLDGSPDFGIPITEGVALEEPSNRGISRVFPSSRQITPVLNSAEPNSGFYTVQGKWISAPSSRAIGAGVYFEADNLNSTSKNCSVRRVVKTGSHQPSR
jgi:GH43 family beta-xylosidase